MANYSKSFNFTNGIQVDTDNFVVNSAGLVGIGTSAPAQFLDVHGSSALRGNTTVTGVTSTTSLYVTGTTDIIGDTKVGSGITLYSSSGIVSATKFYGDGSTLDNVYAVSTGGWFINSSAGIAYTSYKVGIGTTNPTQQLTVNSDGVSNVAKFISNNSGAYIQYSDVNTAVNILTGVKADNYAISIAGDDKFNILSAGNIGIGSTIPTDKLDVKGTTKTTNLNVIGVSTFNDDVILGVGATVGIKTTVYFDDNIKAIFNNNLEIFAGNDSAIRHTNTGAGEDLSIEADTTVYIGKTELSHTMAAFRSGQAVDLYYNNIKRLSTSGVGVTITSQLDVNNINVSSASTIAGITTFTSDTLFTKQLTVSGVTTSRDTLHVFNTTNSSIVAVGNSQSIGDGYNGMLRYAHTGGNFKYSDTESLDVINTSPGNFNFISNPNLIGTSGGFHWLFGEATSPKMTLTGAGRLGIGVTTPDQTLHVAGISTFQSMFALTLSTSDNVDIGGKVTVQGDVIASQDGKGFIGDIITSNGTVLLNSGTNAMGLGANIAVNSNNTTGISTFNDIKVDGVQISTAVGIGTTVSPELAIKTGLVAQQQFSVTQTGHVGIGTSLPRCAVDLQRAGKDAQNRAILLPDMTTNQRNVNMTPGLVGGMIIYNKTLRRIELWDGENWVGITTEA